MNAVGNLARARPRRRFAPPAAVVAIALLLAGGGDTLPRDADSDGDGLPDHLEVAG